MDSQKRYRTAREHKHVKTASRWVWNHALGSSLCPLSFLLWASASFSFYGPGFSIPLACHRRLDNSWLLLFSHYLRSILQGCRRLAHCCNSIMLAVFANSPLTTERLWKNLKAFENQLRWGGSSSHYSYIAALTEARGDPKVEFASRSSSFLWT